ncbi:MAG: hypothetical protein CFE24_10665 [Flavobacterium sp. BFFFF2]|nr:MAG: hypothetical protein CFE24_10665 [Flavobacterium sp. BFFFF2]
MKKLLLATMLFAGIFSSSAQGTCGTATAITLASTTITTPAFPTSTYIAGCLATKTGIRALWYKYTPTSNGEITLSSNFPTFNTGTTYSNDTRVQVLTGTCGATGMTCINYNDDINGSAETDPAHNYLSEVTFQVSAGKTYYIEWDNYWNVGGASANFGFKFSFAFTAQTCIRPGELDFYLPSSATEDAIGLVWKNAIGAPANYDIDWSTDFAAAEGTGTIVSVPAGSLATGTTGVTATQGDLSGLPANSNFRYFVRSDCGATQSGWQGPNYAYLAVPAPYELTFDDVAKNYRDGFVGSGFSLFDTDAVGSTTQAPIYGDGDAGSFVATTTSTTAAANKWGYTRALALTGGSTVTLTFKTRLWVASPTGTPESASINVTVGGDQSSTAQTTILSSITETDSSQYNTQTVTFSPTSDGIYYFGFNNNSAQTTAVNFLLMDSLIVTAAMSTKAFSSSDIVVSPNPTKDVVNVKGLNENNLKTIDITDLNGRTVAHSTYENVSDAQISLASLNTGVYMIKITTDKGVSTQKLIKQ